jgi:hypothetical protein
VKPWPAGTHLALLIALTAAFLFRVVAQLVQVWWPVGFLPSFESWHTATLPYPLLVAGQLTILMAQAWVIVSIAKGGHLPRRRVGQWLLALGSLYFGFMACRLIAGLTFLRHLPWFHAALPAIFHMVLASFLLVLADLHLRFCPRADGS